ncbi:MAG TPA: hypothetical protein VMZ28_25010 [Kofleriaceae bacterium]|nr:hypothetical protein [Kofleriaceae bacterium]
MPRWLFSLALAAACGGSSGQGHEGGTTPAGDRTRTSEPKPAPDAPLTHDECVRMVDHLLDVALTEQRATLPPDKVPTDEQVAQIRAGMHADVDQKCVGGDRRDREQFDCIMAGKTKAEMDVCAPDEGAP